MVSGPRFVGNGWISVFRRIWARGSPRAASSSAEHLHLIAVPADDTDVAVGLHVGRLDLEAVLYALFAQFGH
jgi:hypothetical protein